MNLVSVGCLLRGVGGQRLRFHLSSGLALEERARVVDQGIRSPGNRVHYSAVGCALKGVCWWIEEYLTRDS